MSPNGHHEQWEMFVQLNKSHDCWWVCLSSFLTCYLDIWAKNLCFFFHFSYAVYKIQCWDYIGSEIGLCAKDCFEVESSTLLHVELSIYFASFLCHYFCEIFSYTVCMFWAINHILFHIFTLVMWCASFRTHPWLYIVFPQ